MLKLIPGNAQHIGARKEQQDSFGFSDTRDTALVAHGGLVAAVADGMGGLEGGQQSSSIAIEAFMAAYGRKTPREPVPAALRRSLLEANRAVLVAARQTGTAGNTGTTFAAAAVHNDLLYWIATGDSRIYLVRDGLTVQVNADHTHGTTLWPAVAAGRLSRESALNDPQAPHLTSHLGMEELAHIDLSERPFPLRGDDVIAVCSDGIYRAVSERELAEAFRAAESPSAACSAIQANVLARGSAKQDNLTILAIRCRDDNPVPMVAAVPAMLPGSERPAGRTAVKGPSNLVLASLFCAELLMSAVLGGNYAWSRWEGHTHPQVTGAAVSVAPAQKSNKLPPAGTPNQLSPATPDAQSAADAKHLEEAGRAEAKREEDARQAQEAEQAQAQQAEEDARAAESGQGARPSTRRDEVVPAFARFAFCSRSMDPPKCRAYKKRKGIEDGKPFETAAKKANDDAEKRKSPPTQAQVTPPVPDKGHRDGQQVSPGGPVVAGPVTPTPVVAPNPAPSAVAPGTKPADSKTTDPKPDAKKPNNDPPKTQEGSK